MIVAERSMIVTDKSIIVTERSMIVTDKSMIVTERSMIVPELSNMSSSIDTAWGLVSGKASRFIVGSVYLKLNYKNAVTDLISMLDAAKKLAVQLKAKGVIALGDFNARHQYWGDQVDNAYGKALINQLNFQDFTIVNSKEPTFLSANGQSNIDFMIVSNSVEDLLSDLVTDSGVELFSGAPIRGHLPIETTLRIDCSTSPPPAKLKIDISSIDWDKWTDHVETTLESGKLKFNNSTADEQWQLIDSAIHGATTKYATYKKSSIHSKPFWTDKLTKASQVLRDAKKLYSKRNTISNKAALDSAKEQFDTMRKDECQKFILEKTSNLNVAQSQKF